MIETVLISDLNTAVPPSMINLFSIFDPSPSKITCPFPVFFITAFARFPLVLIPLLMVTNCPLSGASKITVSRLEF
jgi:hypothetical protein